MLNVGIYKCNISHFILSILCFYIISKIVYLWSNKYIGAALANFYYHTVEVAWHSGTASAVYCFRINIRHSREWIIFIFFLWEKELGVECLNTMLPARWAKKRTAFQYLSLFKIMYIKGQGIYVVTSKGIQNKARLLSKRELPLIGGAKN